MRLDFYQFMLQTGREISSVKIIDSQMPQQNVPTIIFQTMYTIVMLYDQSLGRIFRIFNRTWFSHIQITTYDNSINDKQQQMTWSIYVLQLKNNKIYVGKSKDVRIRITEHFQGKGSDFTKEYRPIDIISVYKSSSRFDEDNETKRMMKKYGVKNVRGGSYNRIELTEAQEYFLNKEINTLEERCYNCGKKGHFIGKCKQKKTVEPKQAEIKQTEREDEKKQNEQEVLMSCKRDSPVLVLDSQDEFLQEILRKKRKEDRSF